MFLLSYCVTDMRLSQMVKKALKRNIEARVKIERSIQVIINRTQAPMKRLIHRVNISERVNPITRSVRRKSKNVIR